MRQIEGYGKYMNDKSILFFGAKAAATALIFFPYRRDADLVFLAMSALSFICVFLLQLLLKRVFNRRNISLILIAAAFLAGCFLGVNIFFPLIAILIFEFLDLLTKDNLKYYISAAAVLLCYFIWTPEITAVAVALVLLVYTVSGVIFLQKMDSYRKQIFSQKQAVEDLTVKLSDNKRLIKTLRYSASLEERNRLAARIHDKVGHGISGSIIMLEASLLIMKNDPDKAQAAVEKAVANLREGVDDIRMSLREERPQRSELGLNGIKAVLEEFESAYSMQTVLKQNGRLELISGEVWACINDNLNEALTNALKHSGAACFTLEISVMNKVAKVEYRDNGKSDRPFEKGLGLEAIEERTIKANGRCFFAKTETGFTITNIFTI